MQNSIQIINEGEFGTWQGFITPVILANSHYLMRQYFQDEDVRSSLKRLLRIINIVATNKSESLQALDSNFKEF